MSGNLDTIAAIATAAGKSGIGIVRISGAKSLKIAEKISATRISPRHVHFTTFFDQRQQPIDKGIVLYFKSPNSYTGEDVVELQAHGSSITLNRLLKETCLLGAVPAGPGEFTQRAYLNGKIDLLQAEAVADLIESVSEKAAKYALQSLQGEFSLRINTIVSLVTGVRTLIEGSLDFPEEEIDFLADSDVAGRIEEILTLLDGLLTGAIAGKKLRQGINVVIVGRPNVGKSSLLNILTGADRAIVTELAGTTRDLIEETIFLSGMAITLIDTAGIRSPENVIEEEGIKRSREEIEKADVLVVVTDKPEIENHELRSVVGKSPAKRLIVHNKIDLYDEKPHEKLISGTRHISISARTGEGLDKLLVTLESIAQVSNDQEDLVLARERHIQLISNAKETLQAGIVQFRSTNQVELLAESLREVNQYLGQITGEFHSDDLLGEIFSRFCIGK